MRKQFSVDSSDDGAIELTLTNLGQSLSKAELLDALKVAASRLAKEIDQVAFEVAKAELEWEEAVPVHDLTGGDG